jgi:hypothetical protein
VEKLEKLVPRAGSTVQADRLTFKVGKTFQQNPLINHPRAFVKVVECSEIYNFPIHHLVHFSCKTSSFYPSNSASPEENRPAATSLALQRARAPAHAVHRLGVRAPSRLPEAARLPKAARAPRTLESANATWSPRPRRHPALPSPPVRRRLPCESTPPG